MYVCMSSIYLSIYLIYAMFEWLCMLVIYVCMYVFSMHESIALDECMKDKHQTIDTSVCQLGSTKFRHTIFFCNHSRQLQGWWPCHATRFTTPLPLRGTKILNGGIKYGWLILKNHIQIGWPVDVTILGTQQMMYAKNGKLSTSSWTLLQVGSGPGPSQVWSFTSAKNNHKPKHPKLKLWFWGVTLFVVEPAKHWLGTSQVQVSQATMPGWHTIA